MLHSELPRLNLPRLPPSHLQLVIYPTLWSPADYLNLFFGEISTSTIFFQQGIWLDFFLQMFEEGRWKVVIVASQVWCSALQDIFDLVCGTEVERTPHNQEVVGSNWAHLLSIWKIGAAQRRLFEIQAPLRWSGSRVNTRSSGNLGSASRIPPSSWTRLLWPWRTLMDPDASSH